MSDRYPFRDIEPKWQRLWEERKLFKATEAEGRGSAGASDAPAP